MRVGDKELSFLHVDLEMHIGYTRREGEEEIRVWGSGEDSDLEINL